MLGAYLGVLVVEQLSSKCWLRDTRLVLAYLAVLIAVGALASMPLL